MFINYENIRCICKSILIVSYFYSWRLFSVLFTLWKLLFCKSVEIFFKFVNVSYWIVYYSSHYLIAYWITFITTYLFYLFTCIVILKILNQNIHLNLFSFTYIFSFNIAPPFNRNIQTHLSHIFIFMYLHFPSYFNYFTFQ